MNHRHNHANERRNDKVKRLTATPNKVLVKNRSTKFPKNCMILPEVMWDRSNLSIALKRTTDVASFTTPSPKTRLYRRGVSSWLSTCNINRTKQLLATYLITLSPISEQPYLQCAYRICSWKHRSKCYRRRVNN